MDKFLFIDDKWGYYVGQGIGDVAWFTRRQRRDRPGGGHRVCSKHLPHRGTEDDAVKDLVRFGLKHNLILVVDNAYGLCVIAAAERAKS